MRVGFRVLALCASIAACVPSTAAARVDAGGAELREALQPPAGIEKHPRLDSRVLAVVAADRAHGPAAALQAARARALETSGDLVRLVIRGTPTDVRAAVETQGGAVEATAGELTEALVPAGRLDALSAQRGVEYIRPPSALIPLGTDSQGVADAAANAWHSKGVTGSGAKVAVIDTGFEGLAARQAAGELPASATSVDFCTTPMGAPEKHGTAVAEVVHEMAPSAQLFLICIETEVDLANAAAYVKANGITIVNHSIGWYNTARGDGTGGAGTPDAIVADAHANGVLWINAAGNAAQQHWSGSFTDANGNGVHEFVGSDETNTVTINAGKTVCGFLKWDSWPTTGQDFDLYFSRNSDQMALASSTTLQAGAQTPTEALCYTNPTGGPETYAFAIRRSNASTAPRIDFFVTIGKTLEHQIPAVSLLEPATSASALAVGAHCWSTDALEPYSSHGPTIDGRIKPDLSGPDSVSSALYGAFTACGTSGFNGTSSAAPHVAGAAALLRGMFPLATANELQAWLEDDASDLGPAGKDTSTGSGKLLLPTSAPLTSTLAPGTDEPTTSGFTVTGTVSPLGLATSYRWQYGLTTAYGSQTAPLTLASPRTGQQVSASLTGLAPDTEHHFRLVATSLFGTTFGEDRTRRTAKALPPVAATSSPTSVGHDQVVVAGSVTPNGTLTDVRFEWGTTTGYGNLTPVQSGGATGTNGVTAPLAGLQPSTTYHYRLVASSLYGQSVGSDVTFTTTDPPPPPAPASGGGGGGGSSPNLRLTLAGSRTAIAPNESVDVIATVANAGGAGSLQTRLLIDLPVTMTLLGPPAYDRGSGCTGTQRLDCFLDYLPNGDSTRVLFSVRVAGSGPQTLTATAGADRDSDPADNAASMTLQVSSAPRPTGIALTVGTGTKTGTAGANVLTGDGGANILSGLGGNDRLFGRGGNDTLFGGAGDDVLDGGAGLDRFFGGTGRDTIRARDGRRERIDCGPGRDTAIVDKGDVVRGCETVRRG